MSEITIGYDPTRKGLFCELPITSPTGRVRVKRQRAPVATRQIPLQAEDEIEWQISYFDREKNPIELGELLVLARKSDLISREEIKRFIGFAERQTDFFDATYSIFRTKTQESPWGFQLQWSQVPVLRRQIDRGEAVEIELRHRQRAVGFQAMVFLFIPLRNCLPANLIGRPAHPKERVLWFPTKAVLETLVYAFLIASHRHRDDILELLTLIR